MSTAELKLEIEKVLDKMPDDALESVLEYLKSVAEGDKDDVEFTNNLRKILDEDRELLQRLAL